MKNIVILMGGIVLGQLVTIFINANEYRVLEIERDLLNAKSGLLEEVTLETWCPCKKENL